MKSSRIRDTFLNYFDRHDHEILPSAGLLPSDPDLLFNIAGMVPFKPYFLGDQEPPAPRVSTAQKCLRTEDIDQVGLTARHLTFFEMLGNFSFGDYFKETAIDLAWGFLVEELELNPDRLWITVFGGDEQAGLEADGEARDIWASVDSVDPDQILHLGPEENFWSMAETGPCGPCSEILYDQATGDADPQDVRQSILEGEDRVLELWNLVFMEFNRDDSGNLDPLPQQNIDTGLGLERLAAVMQGADTNFGTDLFQPIIRAVADRQSDSVDPEVARRGRRIIADHVRSTTFLLAEGLIPGNEGRGYVLRRLIRRAHHWGTKTGIEGVFLGELVPVVVELMGDHYEELQDQQSAVQSHLRQEEEQFQQTLDRGLSRLRNRLDDLETEDRPKLDGETIFEFYETHGLPLDITRDVLEERGIQYDEDEIEAARRAHRERSREEGGGGSETSLDLGDLPETQFVGYDTLKDRSQVLALYRERPESDEWERVEELAAEPGLVVLDATPFYPEGGGQVGDRGRINGQRVEDTEERSERILHRVSPDSGDSLAVGDDVEVEVDRDRRLNTMRHHTATHLLQAALRQVLGEHVMQDGSYLDEEYLRFDFTHNESLDTGTLDTVESLINEWIYAALPIEASIMDRREAEQAGALSFFGEHYGQRVRVVRMGEVSMEFCGGTHLDNTQEVGIFTITKETAVAAGVRRIEARAGQPAYDFLTEQVRKPLRSVRNELGIQSLEDAPDRVQELVEQVGDYEEQLESYRQQAGRQRASQLIQEAETIDGLPVILDTVEEAESDTLKETLDEVRNRLERGAVLLINRTADRVQLLVGLSGDPAGLDAGEISQELGRILGGGGGGRPDFAEAGGDEVDALDEVRGRFRSLVEERHAATAGN